MEPPLSVTTLAEATASANVCVKVLLLRTRPLEGTKDAGMNEPAFTVRVPWLIVVPPV